MKWFESYERKTSIFGRFWPFFGPKKRFLPLKFAKIRKSKIGLRSVLILAPLRQKNASSPSGHLPVLPKRVVYPHFSRFLILLYIRLVTYLPRDAVISSFGHDLHKHALGPSSLDAQSFRLCSKTYRLQRQCCALHYIGAFHFFRPKKREKTVIFRTNPHFSAWRNKASSKPIRFSESSIFSAS